MKKLRGCLSVFAIFFCGVVFGVIISAVGVEKKVRDVVEGGPDKVVDMVVARMDHDLHLDGSQKEMLHQIALETRIKLTTIRQKTQPEYSAALAEAADRVRGILNPDQVKKFDEIVGHAHNAWEKKQDTAEKPPSQSADESKQGNVDAEKESSTPPPYVPPSVVSPSKPSPPEASTPPPQTPEPKDPAAAASPGLHSDQ